MMTKTVEINARRLISFGVVIGMFFSLEGCALIGNRFEKQIQRESVSLDRKSFNFSSAPATLTVTTWNIGYGGMGAESDFIFDGGKQRRPLNSKLVDKNIAGILETVSSFDADILLFQEAAKPSWTNYGRDLVEALDDAVGTRRGQFNADIITRGVPHPFRVEIGNSTFFRHQPEDYELIALPLEPYFEFGLFRKNYRIHVLRLDGDTPWTIANIHLSAFDPENLDVRRRQVAAVFEFAEAEYAAGRHVIVGGDWNLVLSKAAFPHKTPREHSFWVREFPKDAIPDGWTVSADDEVPTVRLAHAPYAPGVNRTIAIDGFIVSPNVSVLSVAARDLGFLWSDHNPVTASFLAKR